MDAPEHLPVTWVGSWAMMRLPAELDVNTSGRVAEELISTGGSPDSARGALQAAQGNDVILESRD